MKRCSAFELRQDIYNDEERYTKTKIKNENADKGSRVPVFCGPTMRNLGSRSQVFSFDQISLCLLS